MGGTPRTRNRQLSVEGGRYWSASYTDASKQWTETCDDVVGNPGGDNPFLLRGGATYSGAFNGTRPGYSPGQFGYHRYDNYLPEAVRLLTGVPDYQNWDGEDYYATLLAAKTNPSAPHVSLPVSIAELRDIPAMIRTYGNVVLRFNRGPIKRLRQELEKHKLSWLARGVNDGPIKTAAEHNLAYRFGILPMVSDLRKIMGFQQAVKRRTEELKNLQENGGFKRNVTLANLRTEETYEGVAFDASGIIYVTADRTSGSERKVWGSIRWNPGWGGKLPSTEEGIQKLAARLVLGLDHRQITQNVWNALPWTWLVDWFADVGNFLAANNNTIAHHSNRVCIMNQGRRYNSYTNLSGLPSWLEATGPFEWQGWFWKQRFVPSPPLTPIARLPFLGKGKLSILGSLAILRSRRGYRS